jgi:hypothetical protein
MVNPSVPGVVPAGVVSDLKTRPERRFESRRVFWLGLIVVLLLVCGGVVARGCFSPVGAVSLGAAAPTAVSGVVQIAPTVVVPVVVTPAAVPVSVKCRITGDIPGVFRLPVGGLVVVSGFSYVDGGLVWIADPAIGWVSASVMNCESDVRLLERTYAVTQTPMPVITKPVAGVTPVYVRITVPVPVTVPVSVPTLIGGSIRWSGSGCLVPELQNVKEMWADGRAVAGGMTVCDVRELRVVIR